MKQVCGGREKKVRLRVRKSCERGKESRLCLVLLIHILFGFRRHGEGGLRKRMAKDVKQRP